MKGPTQNLGPIGSAVLTFIGYNGQTDKQSLYIDKYEQTVTSRKRQIISL